MCHRAAYVLLCDCGKNSGKKINGKKVELVHFEPCHKVVGQGLAREVFLPGRIEVCDQGIAFVDWRGDHCRLVSLHQPCGCSVPADRIAELGGGARTTAASHIGTMRTCNQRAVGQGGDDESAI